MHDGAITLDLNWFSQLLLTLFLLAIGVLYLVRNTASRYFEVDGAGFVTDHRVVPAAAVPMELEPCAFCGKLASKKCSRCKSVRYCSSDCQKSDWSSGHKRKCREPERANSTPNGRTSFGLKSSGTIALIPQRGSSIVTRKPREILFPYDEFVKYFNWDKLEFAPCGLINCGNSCFANVVLQCLSFTRPLVAYMLEKGHKGECRCNDWCFFCEFQTHVERASQSRNPFSPINILSRLPNIGGNLGYGRQEDAHEFMRFAIDTMQSACLDEFGGEKVVPPSSQETTLIQHIFGGRLQSQVMCTVCNKISNQYENMMDLTVEIHGDAATLEECLDQFTAKEWLQGENMYKCDGCNDYVKAWKRLTVWRTPNILTIALKRFQGGRFGKLNKRISFPEILNLSPYMSEETDGTEVYKLYAVIVHLDMLNASFFGHYICYTKDFCGNWYRIDDSEVVNVELEEVLSQRAYMLLYSRIHPHPSCLRTDEPRMDKNEKKAETKSCIKELVELSSTAGTRNASSSSESPTSRGSSSTASPKSNGSSSLSTESLYIKDSSIGMDHGLNVKEHQVNVNVVNSQSQSSGSTDVVSEHKENLSIASSSNVAIEEVEDTSVAVDPAIAMDSEVVMKDLVDTEKINGELISLIAD